MHATRGSPQALAQAVEPLAALVDGVENGVVQTFVQVRQLAQPGQARRRAQLSSGAGRGCAQVGDEIGQGEIGFVSDTAHHRHRRLGQGTHQLLVVEGPQIFQRTAAAHQQQHLGLALLRKSLVGQPQGRAQFGRRLRALHGAGINVYRQVRHTPAQRAGHVAQGGRAQRSHHADAARLRRQRSFARGIEQTFGLEPGFEAQKLLEPHALPGRLQALDDQLQFAARTVDVELAARLHQLAVARDEGELIGSAAKQRAAQLHAIVLEQKITMPADGAGKTGHLAPHHDRVQTHGQRVGHGAHERAQRPDRATVQRFGSQQGLSHRIPRSISVHNPSARQGFAATHRTPAHTAASGLIYRRFAALVRFLRGRAALQAPSDAGFLAGSSQSYPQNQRHPPGSTNASGLRHNSSLSIGRPPGGLVWSPICFPSYKPLAGRSGP